MRQSMEYARRLADPTYDTRQTAVSKFKLVYPSGSLHQKSRSYFKIKQDAYAQAGEQAVITISKPFVLGEHQNIVKEHTKLYKDKSAALVSLDKKIIAAVLVALVAMHTPFIPFVGMIAIAGWLAALYWMNQRAQAYLEYYDALLLLVATCSWCLGPNENDDLLTTIEPQFQEQADSTSSVLEDRQVQNMMDQLYSVLSKSQISHFLSPENWAKYRVTIERHDNRLHRRLSSFFGHNASQSSRFAQVVNNELESTALKQRSAEFLRCIYGLNRGTSGDFLRVLLHAIPDLCYAVWHAGQAYFSPSSPQPAAPPQPQV